MSEESTSSNPASTPQAEKTQPPEKLVPSTIFGTAPTARCLAGGFLASSVARRTPIQPVTATTPPAMEAMVASVDKSTPQAAAESTTSSPKSTSQAKEPQSCEKPEAEGSPQKIRRGSIWA